MLVVLSRRIIGLMCKNPFLRGLYWDVVCLTSCPSWQTWRKTHVLPAGLSNTCFAVWSHGRQVNVEILLPRMQGICEFMLAAQQDPDPEVWGNCSFVREKIQSLVADRQVEFC